MADGSIVVLKVSPSSDTPLLTYEHGIMATEAAFYEAAATTGIPVPRVIHTDYTHRIVDSDLLLMTRCARTQLVLTTRSDRGRPTAHVFAATWVGWSLPFMASPDLALATRLRVWRGCPRAGARRSSR